MRNISEIEEGRGERKKGRERRREKNRLIEIRKRDRHPIDTQNQFVIKTEKRVLEIEGEKGAEKERKRKREREGKIKIDRGKEKKTRERYELRPPLYRNI